MTREERQYLREFGATLKDARKRRKITQGQLYARSGICQNSISDYERGRCSPTLLKLHRLAKGLGCDVWDLLP